MTEMTLVAIKVEKKNILRRNERRVTCRDCHTSRCAPYCTFFRREDVCSGTLQSPRRDNFPLANLESGAFLFLKVMPRWR